MNSDRVTTAIGTGVATLTLLQIDAQKLASLDKAELIRLGLVALFALWGWYSNRKEPAK